ncbi:MULTISPECIES: hypothetical protein [unclassified Pseudoalteromonas]|uniref:hypothetical protein n=1 Tax=unclassified Pseudoalteromonas TaxID=194690 RepID=UPI000976005C|nr:MULTISPECIES: hypothetical protein [unclassified Pseudoalteromonas]MDN3488419.1 hypothetical protein [Pseudoalteromonas sp. APC 3694]
MEIINKNPGSFDNPITIKNKHQNSKLSKEYRARDETYIHRLLLQSSTKNNNGDIFAFDKAPEGDEHFALNVISNPNLQPLDIKIALALFEILEWRHKGDGMVYLCTSKELDLENYGEFGEDIVFSDGFEREIDPIPLAEQLSALFKNSISTEALNKVLSRLDSFHYINVTPVTMANCIFSPALITQLH